MQGSSGSLQTARPTGADWALALGAQERGVDSALLCSYGVSMSDLRFAWDPKKDSQNRRKHRVSFAEAETVFGDEHALLIDDPEHSTAEDRFILLGVSAKLRILVVAHAYREDQGLIRIISARKATRSERAQYARRWER